MRWWHRERGSLLRRDPQTEVGAALVFNILVGGAVHVSPKVPAGQKSTPSTRLWCKAHPTGGMLGEVWVAGVSMYLVDFPRLTAALGDCTESRGQKEDPVRRWIRDNAAAMHTVHARSIMLHGSRARRAGIGHEAEVEV